MTYLYSASPSHPAVFLTMRWAHEPAEPDRACCKLWAPPEMIVAHQGRTHITSLHSAGRARVTGGGCGAGSQAEGDTRPGCCPAASREPRSSVRGQARFPSTSSCDGERLLAFGCIPSLLLCALLCCRAAVQSGLGQKRKAGQEAQNGTSKLNVAAKKGGMLADVLGDLSEDEEDDDSHDEDDS